MLIRMLIAALIVGSPVNAAKVQPPSGGGSVSVPDVTQGKPSAPVPVPYPITDSTNDIPGDQETVMTPGKEAECGSGGDKPSDSPLGGGSGLGSLLNEDCSD